MPYADLWRPLVAKERRCSKVSPRVQMKGQNISRLDIIY